jgi:hypothetical protein
MYEAWVGRQNSQQRQDEQHISTGEKAKVKRQPSLFKAQNGVSEIAGMVNAPWSSTTN